MSIGYDDLVTYCVLVLSSSKKKATFEDIVAQAFTLFPKRFALRGYPEWPDSAVVNKSWLRCRTDKHYIEGSVKDGFQLTPKGIKIAETVAQKLDEPTMIGAATHVLTETRTRAGRMVRAIEQSAAGQHFLVRGDITDLGDHLLTDMLRCMPDSKQSVIKQNIEQFSQAAAFYERPDILELLALVTKRLTN